MSYRDEEVANLHKKVSDLQDLLKKRVAGGPSIQKTEWIMPKVEDAFAWLAWTTVSVVVGLGLWSLAHVIFSSAKIDYCYANYGETSHAERTRGDFVYLVGHRTWQTDIVLSKHAHFHDAVLAAEEMHCPLTLGVVGVPVQPADAGVQP